MIFPLHPWFCNWGKHVHVGQGRVLNITSHQSTKYMGVMADASKTRLLRKECQKNGRKQAGEKLHWFEMVEYKKRGRSWGGWR